MEIGAVFPTCEIGNDPAAIRDFAQTAEALGYGHIIVYDHVLGAEHADREPPLWGPYTENDPFHEPMTLIGYLAAATRRIHFTTGVLIMPQRQTALVAKQAVELALLSEGRFRLGMGTGWNWVEYEALGTRFADRGRRFDEQVKVLKQLLGERIVRFDGAYHRIDRAGLLPLPEHPIPLWFGGMTTPALRRAVAHGDGFLFGSAREPMLDACRTLRKMLVEAGRESDFAIDTMVQYGEGPDAWRSAIETWREVGATGISMRAMSTGTALLGEQDPGFTRPQQHIDALEDFMKVAREVVG